jgi:hypothetical protein
MRILNKRKKERIMSKECEHEDKIFSTHEIEIPYTTRYDRDSQNYGLRKGVGIVVQCNKCHEIRLIEK